MTTNPYRDTAVIIPAYNEGNRIAMLIHKLKSHGFHKLIVVDDGSEDHTADEVRRCREVILVSHITNLGPGASTMTGLSYALTTNADYFATIDADLQHDPGDLIGLVREIKQKKLDLLIGSRFLQSNPIPFSRWVYNKVGNWVSYFKTGLLMSDSQSGLKVMTREFVEKLYIDYNGFEFCIDIIKKARLNNISVGESPVSVSYTKETISKGQNFESGLSMLEKLLNPFQ